MERYTALWKVLSSGTWRRVVRKVYRRFRGTYCLIFRCSKSKLRKQTARSKKRRDMTMEAIYSSETSVSFNGLRGIKSQKIALFIVTAVENLKSNVCNWNMPRVSTITPSVTWRLQLFSYNMRGKEIEASKRMYEYQSYMSMEVSKLRILGTIPPLPCHHGVVLN
jgi:hypothetical protein